MGGGILRFDHDLGFDAKDVAALFGLSGDEFRRYVGMGLIRITAPEEPKSEEALTAWEIQMGNKVIAAWFYSRRLTRHEIRFARGKKSGLMKCVHDKDR
ncbi:hypothetical protein [Neorhizobium sp. LjRoot104]|uniref:hypothetical protein n=1 Tax=Neorhizobium sp. LjRoot104 TaxID=3342254 RepID=UPI003ECFBC72